MTSEKRVTFMGAPGSPYTRKMLACLRYRQIPHRIIWGDPSNLPERIDGLPVKPAKLPMHPTFFFREGDAMQATLDSTPIIRRLEADYPDRSVIPGDPALAFINDLLEDFGDEWVTKMMFHYRWHYEADADVAGTLIPLWMVPGLPPEQLQEFKGFFSKRQIDRLWVVGSSPETAAIIEESYKRLLDLLDAHFQRSEFLLGSRPSSADFAIYGQFTQLFSVDPTPAALAMERCPRAVAWVSRMEDLSGLEPTAEDWLSVDEVKDLLYPLLLELGRAFVPAMLANAAALAAGDKEWTAEVDGAQWRQKSFPYQGKCMQWVREGYATLDEATRAQVDSILDGSGCEPLVK